MLQSQYKNIVFYVVLFNLIKFNFCIYRQTRNININIKKLNIYTTTSIKTMFLCSHDPKTVTVLIDDKLSDSIYKTLYSVGKIWVTTNLLKDSILNNKNIIITIKNMSQLYEFFNKAFYSIYWKYLIITDFHKNELLDIVNVIWKYNYVYVAFLIVSNNGNVTFHKFDCNKNRKRHILLNDYDCTSLNDAFNFESNHCVGNGHSLTYARVNEGVELPQHIQPANFRSRGGFIIEKFCDELELECNKILNTNLTWNILVDWINQSKVDIIYGSDLPTNHQIDYLDVSGSYGKETFVFIDTAFYESMNITSFLLPFHWQVWLCMIISALFYIILLLFTRQLKQLGIIYENLRIIDLYAILFTQNVRFPKQPVLRFVFYILLLSTMVINTLYLSNLKSAIILTRETRLNDFEDIRIFNRNLGGPAFIKDFLFDKEDNTIFELYKRYQVLKPNEILKALETENTIVALPETMVLNIFEQKIKNSQNSTIFSNIYKIKQDVAGYPLLLYMRRDNPYLPKISKFSSRIFESGILQTYINYQYPDLELLEVENVSKSYLKLKQITLACQLLLAGYLIGVILFLFERIIKIERKLGNYKNNTKKRHPSYPPV